MHKEAEKFANSNMMEGFLSIQSVLWGAKHAANTRSIQKVFVSDRRSGKKEREISQLKRWAKEFSFPVQTLPLHEIEEMTVGNTHGGMVAICTDREIPTLRPEHILPEGSYLMLEGIEDPYNFGYALRSAYAAGIDAIILSPRNWMSAAGVVCRASAGASERFSMYISDASQAALMFHQAGYRVVCAEKKNAEPLTRANLKKPLFLIIGGEKRGISASTLSLADQRVCIEYGRPFAASLSAASAASILAFEILRQNPTNA